MVLRVLKFALVLKEGKKVTFDLAKKNPVGTREMAKEVIKNI